MVLEDVRRGLPTLNLPQETIADRKKKNVAGKLNSNLQLVVNNDRFAAFACF